MVNFYHNFISFFANYSQLLKTLIFKSRGEKKKKKKKKVKRKKQKRMKGKDKKMKS
jgi:hypothetical protein